MTENELKINRCPVCGRLPRIRFSGFNWGENPSCDIYCKPFLRKTHLGVTHFILIDSRCIIPPFAMMGLAKEKAIQLWNKKAKEVTNNDGE